MTALRSILICGGVILLAVSCGLSVAAPAALAQKEEARNLDQIPKTVMDALEARFPYAEVSQWTREEEDDIVLYDIEFTQQGLKFEADIIEDGRIHNWERAVAATDLPKVVLATVVEKYSTATMKEIMAITAVTNGNEALEGYEIVLETADGNELEVTVAPDGTILEEGTP